MTGRSGALFCSLCRVSHGLRELVTELTKRKKGTDRSCQKIERSVPALMAGGSAKAGNAGKGQGKGKDAAAIARIACFGGNCQLGTQNVQLAQACFFLSAGFVKLSDGTHGQLRKANRYKQKALEQAEKETALPWVGSDLQRTA